MYMMRLYSSEGPVHTKVGVIEILHIISPCIAVNAAPFLSTSFRLPAPGLLPILTSVINEYLVLYVLKYVLLFFVHRFAPHIFCAFLEVL